ncbi:hypothetical protein [Streptomyces sp. NPDC058572]|uniref:hypothetical protein n=1 Tax=Streptomyces sp. NPDC058572 TaxID=3346546 RepID=UPI0036667004
MQVKTAARSVTVTAACVLLSLTACTSSGGDSDKNASTGASAGAGTGRSTAPGEAAGDGGSGNGGTGGDPSVPLTEPQLERAAIATGDLPKFQVSSERSPLAPTGQPTADKKKCQPLADAMGDEPNAQATRTVNRGLGSLENLGLAVSVSVSSYRESDAERLMTGLGSALEACREGFSASLDDRAADYDDIRTTRFTVRGADETVSWTAVATDEGLRSPVHLVVVRKGATVARFMAFDLARRTPPRVPQQVADKQLAKVARALAG